MSHLSNEQGGAPLVRTSHAAHVIEWVPIPVASQRLGIEELLLTQWCREGKVPSRPAAHPGGVALVKFPDAFNAVGDQQRSMQAPEEPAARTLTPPPAPSHPRPSFNESPFLFPEEVPEPPANGNGHDEPATVNDYATPFENESPPIFESPSEDRLRGSTEQNHHVTIDDRGAESADEEREPASEMPEWMRHLAGEWGSRERDVETVESKVDELGRDVRRQASRIEILQRTLSEDGKKAMAHAANAALAAQQAAGLVEQQSKLEEQQQRAREALERAAARAEAAADRAHRVLNEQRSGTEALRHATDQAARSAETAAHEAHAAQRDTEQMIKVAEQRIRDVAIGARNEAARAEQAVHQAASWAFEELRKKLNEVAGENGEEAQRLKEELAEAARGAEFAVHRARSEVENAAQQAVRTLELTIKSSQEEAARLTRVEAARAALAAKADVDDAAAAARGEYHRARSAIDEAAEIASRVITASTEAAQRAVGEAESSAIGRINGAADQNAASAREHREAVETRAAQVLDEINTNTQAVRSVASQAVKAAEEARLTSERSAAQTSEALAQAVQQGRRVLAAETEKAQEIARTSVETARGAARDAARDEARRIVDVALSQIEASSSQVAREQAVKQVEEVLAPARAEMDQAREELDSTRMQALSEVQRSVEAAEVQTLKRFHDTAGGIVDEVKRAAALASASADKAAKHASEGAIAKKAQEAAARAAEEAAQRANVATQKAHEVADRVAKEEEARAAQRQATEEAARAAQASRQIVTSGSHALEEATRRAEEAAREQQAAKHALEEAAAAARRSVETAKELLGRMESIVEGQSSEQQKMLESHLEAVKNAEDAAKAAQGAARAAQAASVAAQRDATDVAVSAQRVIDISGEFPQVPSSGPMPPEPPAPSPAPSAFDELKTPVPNGAPAGEELFWTEPEHSTDDFLFDDGDDEGRLGKFWRRRRSKDHASR